MEQTYKSLLVNQTHQVERMITPDSFISKSRSHHHHWDLSLTPESQHHNINPSAPKVLKSPCPSLMFPSSPAFTKISQHLFLDQSPGPWLRFSAYPALSNGSVHPSEMWGLECTLHLSQCRRQPLPSHPTRPPGGSHGPPGEAGVLIV